MEKSSPSATEENTSIDLGHKENAVLRSMRVVDLVCDTATEFIMEFIENQNCPESEALLARPEVLGFRALEAAMHYWVNGGRRPEQQVH